jgi:PKD repeat protein
MRRERRPQGPTATAVPANAPPVANAGSNQSGQTLTALSFNGSASFDPDGTIASYNWNFGDGSSASGMSVSHSYAVGGSTS